MNEFMFTATIAGEVMFGDRNEMPLYIDDCRGNPGKTPAKVTVPPSFFLPPDSWPEEGEKIRLEGEFYVYDGQLLMEFNKITRFVPDDGEEEDEDDGED